MKEVTDEENRLRVKWFNESGEKAYVGRIGDGDEVVFKNDYVLWLEKRIIDQEYLESILADIRLSRTSNFHKEDNPISDEIYLVLEEMDIETSGEVGKYLNSISPQLTVCPKCHVDDFVHVGNCEFYKRWSDEE